MPKDDTPKGGPMYTGIGLAESEDAFSFKKLDRFFSTHGSVPCLISTSNGTIFAAYQYFNPKGELLEVPDGTFVSAYTYGMAITKSDDNGKTWSRYKRVKLKELPENMRGSPCEPAITLLEDGRMRLYFMSSLAEKTPCIFSAISSDYEYFEFEKGIRFEDDIRTVIDPAIIKIGNKWHFYAPYEYKFVVDPNRNYHATSIDGLNFKREADIIGVGDQFRGNALAIKEGYRFFTIGHDEKEKRKNISVKSAFSKDGYNWVLESGVRLGGDDGPHDASVTRLKDGTYLMAYVTKALRDNPFE